MKCVLDEYNYQEKEDINPYLDRSEDDPQRIIYDLRKMAAEKDELFFEAMEKNRNKNKSVNKSNPDNKSNSDNQSNPDNQSSQDEQSREINLD